MTTDDLITIFFWWNLLAWVAVGMRCELGESPFLTICQMFWIMVLWPPLMALGATLLFLIGTAVPKATAVEFVKGIGVVGGIIIGVCGGAFVVAMTIEYSQECRIIWRKKS